MKIAISIVFVLAAVSLVSAQKLEIYPDNAKVQPGDSIVFTAIIHSPDGTVYSSPKVKWRAKGGKITKGGRFVAGVGLGKFSVAVVYQKMKAEAKLLIVKKPTNNSQSENRIEIYPNNARVEPGNSVIFTAIIHSSGGIMYSSPKIKWRAKGGKITKGGRFIAGKNPGKYPIQAVYKDKTARVEIFVGEQTKEPVATTTEQKEIVVDSTPIPCTTCKATGIMDCPCKGKGSPCPGPCLKLGVGNWENKPPHGLIHVWYYTDRQGRKRWQGAKPSHVGEVLYIKDGKFIKEGKCKICKGKSVVPCKLCSETGKATCTTCKGSKTITPDNSNVIQLKDGTIILGNVVGQAGDTVMIKTLEGKYLKFAKSEIKSLPSKK